MTKYNNKQVSVSYFEKREGSKAYIMIRDLTDLHNEPSGYTRKVRGIELAWKFLEQIFTKEELKDDLTFYDIINILDKKFNLNVHTYCALD